MSISVLKFLGLSNSLFFYFVYFWNYSSYSPRFMLKAVSPRIVNAEVRVGSQMDIVALGVGFFLFLSQYVYTKTVYSYLMHHRSYMIYLIHGVAE